jgi:hypothetical protein
MNSNWFIALGIALVFGLFGIASAGKQVHLLELWWDQREGPETATASALAPIIDCVNRVDRDTRLAYYQLVNPQGEKTQQALADREEFGDTREPQPDVIRKDVCAPKITVKLERLLPDSRLIGVTERYVSSLEAMTTKATDLKLSESQGQSRRFADSTQAFLKKELISTGIDYASKSAELRRSLEREEQRVRPAQLALLEARFGRDMQWHLLKYMITARQAVNQIEQGMRDASLTPQHVADLTEAVRKAAEDSRIFLNAMPSRRPDDEAIHLWYNIKAPADEYLKALDTLRQDWQNHAAPQQLSDDYYLVTRRYDALLSYYNRLARNAF